MKAIVFLLLFLLWTEGAARSGDPVEEASGNADPEPSAAETPEAPPVPTDPRDGLVPLRGLGGWDASLVIDNGGVGIWTVGSFQVFPQYGCPEVVGLDDKGRLLVLVSYSGRWSPFPAVYDGRWLGGMAHGDVDPRVPGPETYVGSRRGNVYQVVGHAHTTLESRLVVHLRGREIHTIVSGDLDPRVDGPELIVFTRPGGLYRIAPTGAHGGFDTVHLADLPGRVRDAVVLPGTPPEIATVARTGRLRILRLTGEGARWRTLYEAPMGMGRIALRPARTGAPRVLYSTHDDGRILRHEEGADGAWRTETIYLGPAGPRGIAAGRFHEDPASETVAVFGYSGRVQLLRRTGEGWRVETIFQDRDKGHWLAVAEVDGRNGTRELISSGYSGRIVLLSRPPGYARAGATEPAPE